MLCFILFERFVEYVVLQHEANLSRNSSEESGTFKPKSPNVSTCNVSTYDRTDHHANVLFYSYNNHECIDHRVDHRTVNNTLTSAGTDFTYTRHELLSLRKNHSPLCDETYNNIKGLGIARRCRPRGRRAGTHMLKKTNEISSSTTVTIGNDHEHQNPNSVTRPAAGMNKRKNLKIHSWNANRLSNKTAILVDHIVEHDVDIMCITETWLKEDSLVIIGECTLSSLIFHVEITKKGEVLL